MADLGLSNLMAVLLRMGAKVDANCVGVTEKHTKAMAEHMRANVAVDTGATRDSVGYEVTVRRGLVTGEAGATTRQSRYLEGGTADMAPQPFAGPALEAETEGYVESIADAAVEGW